MKCSKTFIVTVALLKCSKIFIVTVFVLVLVGRRHWYGGNKEAHAPLKSVTPEQDMTDYRHPHLPPTNNPAPNPQPSSNQVPHDLGFRQSVKSANRPVAGCDFVNRDSQQFYYIPAS